MGKESQQFEGVRAKLAKRRDEGPRTRTDTLPISEVIVEIPTSINHRAWMSAQKQANRDAALAQAIFVLETVTFEGEKLTLADLNEGLIDSRDMLHLIGEIFGDEGGAEGNAA